MILIREILYVKCALYVYLYLMFIIFNFSLVECFEIAAIIKEQVFNVWAVKNVVHHVLKHVIVVVQPQLNHVLMHVVQNAA